MATTTRTREERYERAFELSSNALKSEREQREIFDYADGYRDATKWAEEKIAAGERWAVEDALILAFESGGTTVRAKGKIDAFVIALA